MGNHSASRRVKGEIIRFRQTYLKRKIQHIHSLGILDKHSVIHYFRKFNPDTWHLVKNFHEEYSILEKRRLKNKKKSVYAFRNVEDFFWNYAKFVGSGNFPHLQEEEKELEIQNLLKHGKERSLKLCNAETNRNRLLQTATPKYSNYYEKTYFYPRKKFPRDIDSRYIILHEAAKYKCNLSISFLHKINACERNAALRKFAYDSLLRLGYTDTRLCRKRKGKKRETDSFVYTPITTPQELIKRIYNSPLEQMKQYDVFLSHSYRDKDNLVKIKERLNQLNLNVYLDWVNDKDELQRSLACAETASVLVERIKSSQSILYIHTKDSLNSHWTPWELGLGYALKKKIGVLYGFSRKINLMIIVK